MKPGQPTSDLTSPHRRDFIKQLAGANSLAPVVVPARVFGTQAPSERVNLAIFGVGGRGSYLLSRFMEFSDVRVVAICDAYRSRREQKRQELNRYYGGDYVRAYQNPWEIFDRSDVDAVVIATPDHWHVPLALAAARAGKDMYVEKPLSVAMTWSWRLREELRKNGRIFQYGTQQRSEAHFRYACELVRNGYLGEIQRVEVWCPDASQQWESYGGRPSLSVPRYGSLRPVEPPEDLDYDLWCGPAPLRPYTVDRCTSFGAYHIYDYSLGFIAGWGVHPLDIAQWGLGMDHTSPVFYEGTGHIPEYGLLDTVDQWDIHCYYANGVRLRFMDFRTARPVVSRYRQRWSDHGTTFFGTQGWISVDRGGLEASRPSLQRVEFRANDERLYRSDDHYRNFIDCVKRRQPTVSPFEAALRCDTISHLSDLVVRLRRPLEWDPQTEKVVNDQEANRRLHRDMRAKWAI